MNQSSCVEISKRSPPLQIVKWIGRHIRCIKTIRSTEGSLALGPPLQVARPNCPKPVQGVLRSGTSALRGCIRRFLGVRFVLHSHATVPGGAQRRPGSSLAIPGSAPCATPLQLSPGPHSRSTIVHSPGRAADGTTASWIPPRASAGIFVPPSRSSCVAYLPEAPPLLATTRLRFLLRGSQLNPAMPKWRLTVQAETATPFTLASSRCNVCDVHTVVRRRAFSRETSHFRNSGVIVAWRPQFL